MESITQSQFNNLLKGQVDLTLASHVQADINFIKTILLTQQGDEYFVEFIDLSELCEEEISENKSRGTLVTIS
tara:strand:- start:182 stop:400 length:219 start_codon:yes stop_codon:yes gene_type:complete